MPAEYFYEFGPFRLDPAKRLLLRDRASVPLQPKALDMLLLLVERRGQVLEKDELMQALWPDCFVEEANLTINISALRKALGERPREHNYIVTVPGRGYRFVAGVRELAAEGSDLVLEHTRVQVVIEAEEERLEAGNGHSLPAPSEPLRLSGRRRSRRTVYIGLMCALVVAAAVALVLYHYRATPAAGQAAPIRSIAVLPLKNLTGDPAQDYFSDGLTESLITALSKTGDLTVISRGSVFSFKGREVDPHEVGEQLGVAAVLEGSVRKSADSVRVAVRLVSAADGRVLWARDTQDRALGDLFALQDEIARGVAAGLRLKLSPEGEQRLAKRYTDSVEADEAYKMGRYFWNKRTEDGLKKGIEYFQQAIRIDPGYALAYAGLADSYAVMGSFSLLPSEEARAKAKAAAMKALELDEGLAEAHAALAWLDRWDRAGAERAFKRALELNPNHETAHQWYAEYLSAAGRFDQAIAEIRRAQQIDPTSLIVNAVAGMTYYFARRNNEAIEQCRKTIELEPNFFLGHHFLAGVYAEIGRYEEALAAAKKAQQLEDNPITLCQVGYIYAASGNRAEAEQVLRELIGISKRKYVPPYHMAVVYARLGEREAAFEWLEKAVKGRQEQLVYLKVDPYLDPLRSDPRFADLLRRVGLP